MMTCSICGGNYCPPIIYGNPDPGESCRCGMMTEDPPYSYAGWDGLIKYYRFKIGDWVIDLGCRILP